jgi:hypothetical protein
MAEEEIVIVKGKTVEGKEEEEIEKAAKPSRQVDLVV